MRYTTTSHTGGVRPVARGSQSRGATGERMDSAGARAPRPVGHRVLRGCEFGEQTAPTRAGWSEVPRQRRMFKPSRIRQMGHPALSRQGKGGVPRLPPPDGWGCTRGGRSGRFRVTVCGYQETFLRIGVKASVLGPAAQNDMADDVGIDPALPRGDVAADATWGGNRRLGHVGA